MLALIINVIVFILFVIYLIKDHTWYQIALLGLLLIGTGLAEEFTSWHLDFWSYFVGVMALAVLNLQIRVVDDEDEDE